MKKIAFALLLAASACSGGGGGGNAGPSAEAPFIAKNDVEYIDSIVPHHWESILLIDEVLARGSDAGVRSLAGTIQSDTLQQIHRMEVVRLKLTGSSETPQLLDPHFEHALERLAALSGDELDKAFLEEMIPHHGTAIDLSHRAMPALLDAEVQEIALSIFVTDARQIGLMVEMWKPSD